MLCSQDLQVDGGPSHVCVALNKQCAEVHAFPLRKCYLYTYISLHGSLLLES